MKPLKAKRHSMKFRALWVAGVFLAGTSVALGHSTRWTWTASKAEQVVIRDARIRLPLFERATLEEELGTRAAYFRALEAAAFGEESAYAVTYHDLAHRYRRALASVQDGLEIDEAECSGSGRGARRKRFRHFRCPVTSEVLEIPSATIVPSEDGTLPAVVEGQPRRIGPFQAQLNVHVTGQSTIAYRSAADRSAAGSGDRSSDFGRRAEDRRAGAAPREEPPPAPVQSGQSPSMSTGRPRPPRG